MALLALLALLGVKNASRPLKNKESAKVPEQIFNNFTARQFGTWCAASDSIKKARKKSPERDFFCVCPKKAVNLQDINSYIRYA